MEKSDISSRRKVIEELVDRWVRKNPEALQTFASQVRLMRQGRPKENKTHVYRATIPGDLMRQLEFAVSSGDARLFAPDGELEWFCKKYPEFTIPYDRTETAG